MCPDHIEVTSDLGGGGAARPAQGNRLLPREPLQWMGKGTKWRPIPQKVAGKLAKTERSDHTKWWQGGGVTRTLRHGD